MNHQRVTARPTRESGGAPDLSSELGIPISGAGQSPFRLTAPANAYILGTRTALPWGLANGVEICGNLQSAPAELILLLLPKSYYFHQTLIGVGGRAPLHV